MTQKLTEEQQRSAHKIIKANQGDCTYKGNYLNCHECPKGDDESFECCNNFPGDLCSPEFQAENLRTSQAWLDAHITDAEIMAESPREFCERMVRTEGKGRCRSNLKLNYFSCDNCTLAFGKNVCGSPVLCRTRAQDHLALLSAATLQEPPKRRPTPEEMVVEPKASAVDFHDWCGKKVVFKDGRNNGASYIVHELTRNISTNEFYFRINKFNGPQYSARLFNLCETKNAVEPEPVAKAPTPETKEKSEFTVKGDVDKLPIGFRFINFRDLLPTDALRIIALEGQVKDLTKKNNEKSDLIKNLQTREINQESLHRKELDLWHERAWKLAIKLSASTKRCEKLQRRLRAKWEAKRDGEMATEEEIVKWWQSNLGGVEMRSKNPKDWKVHPKGRTDWIPATRGNLKL